jgi:hypothetical protein
MSSDHPVEHHKRDNMTEKQINLTLAAVIILAVAGYAFYQLSLAYPRNSYRAAQFDRCEMVVGSSFRFDGTARLFCQLDAMDQLREWAAKR